MSNSYTVTGTCPGCRRYFKLVPTEFEGVFPCGGTCPHCEAKLRWPVDDKGLILTEFKPAGMVEGEQPTATVTINQWPGQETRDSYIPPRKEEEGGR